MFINGCISIGVSGPLGPSDYAYDYQARLSSACFRLAIDPSGNLSALSPSDNKEIHHIEAPRSNGKTFLVFTYIWLILQEDVAKIPEVPGPLAIVWLVSVTIYCTIFQ